MSALFWVLRWLFLFDFYSEQARIPNLEPLASVQHRLCFHTSASSAY